MIISATLYIEREGNLKSKTYCVSKLKEKQREHLCGVHAAWKY